MEDIAEQLALQVKDQLPAVLQQLREGGFDAERQPLRLECSLTAVNADMRISDRHVPVASINLGIEDISPSPRSTLHGAERPVELLCFDNATQSIKLPRVRRTGPLPISTESEDSGTSKRRRLSSGPGKQPCNRSVDLKHDQVGPLISDERHGAQRQKRPPSNTALSPSTLDKFISGVWESIYSGVRLDPTEVIQQWQAIESSGQPKLLTDAEENVIGHNGTSAFGRINILTRRISQTSKTCRSLEVVIQAHWIQCFDDRVAELSASSTSDRAKKAAIAEACGDFDWTEKELRNKMAIWRGYHDIKCAAGWVALVFAGTGMYRFCKYRVSFNEATFEMLRRLRHRFELAADTLHPRWRTLLVIVGESAEPKYKGHQHHWVVNGPGNEAMPLAQTYHQWDQNFSYDHLKESRIDEEAWDTFDPRTVIFDRDAALRCQVCNELQSNDAKHNACGCYPNLYGNPKGDMVPLQVFRTANGKNNGLLACCPFEKGWAVGEFVGLITSGLTGMDVMVGQTENAAAYQIWQGKEGNHTRFVNHSCQPNSHFERFVWLGKQRIVLVSDGIGAGEEVTVDYGHTYWENLDKECKCGQPDCRYRDRSIDHRILQLDEHEHV